MRFSQAGLRLAVVFAAVFCCMSSEAWADLDVTPPEPPSGVFITEGTAWQPVNGFNVSWQNSTDQQTPIAAVHYELCPTTPPGPCTVGQIAGAGISQALITVPAAGWFWLRLWLEDEAGNANSDDASAQVMLRFDDQLPPEPFLQVGNVWLDATTPASPTFDVEIDPGAAWPVSGVAGYSISLGNALPDASVEVFADQDYERFSGQFTATDLAEGSTTVRFRSVSGSGVASQVVGSSVIRLDRTPPIVSANGLGVAGIWQRETVMGEVTGLDQDQLSGMVPAAPDRPIDEGAYLRYELDDDVVLRRGGSATLSITEDGAHHLTYQAYDAAGNASQEKEVSLKIDKTAPVGAFRAQDGTDPRLVRVDVSDATSGVASGRIEYRRVGDGEFKRLETARDGGRLTARLDDLALPFGRYELRAVVTDVAGNEGVIAATADGRAVTLGLPLRALSQLTTSLEPVALPKRCAKTKRQVKKRRAKRTKAGCKKAKTAAPRLFGKQTKTTGRLTAADGTPLANTVVTVEGQPRSGGAFVSLGSARTDANGGFRFNVPRGPSRIVRYSYAGSDTRLPATATLATKVKAAARLKVNRRRLANGQAVRFSGRLLGKPIPRAGKLVALQAKVGRGWRTFATPRANAKGLFKHRYRFTATTGLRRYVFRAVVTREGAYPYEEGASKTVRVTVRGR